MATAAAAAAVTPADFLGLQAIGLFLRRHGGLRGVLRQLCILIERLRHQRRGLRCGGKGRDSSGNTRCDLEKFTPFHLFFLLQGCGEANKFRLAAMNTYRDACIICRDGEGCKSRGDCLFHLLAYTTSGIAELVGRISVA
jgi:hypothetical protein